MKNLLTRTEAITAITRTKVEDRDRCSFCGCHLPSLLCEAPRCPLLLTTQLNGAPR